MSTNREKRTGQGWAAGRLVCVAGVGLVALTAMGCGDRRITFMQDPFINTAVHCDRRAEDRTGEPLELAIVCVYPKDLENDANHGLRHGAGITSQEWYEKRPIPGDEPDSKATHPRFRLPRSRVYLLTNAESESQNYGKRIAPALNGAKIDGQAKVVQANIEFDSWILHDKESVIYVFAKFKDSKGNVLRVPPAMFDPPGAYTRDIQLKIGVKKDEECRPPTLGQYIENITERKMHREMHKSAQGG